MNNVCIQQQQYYHTMPSTHHQYSSETIPMTMNMRIALPPQQSTTNAAYYDTSTPANPISAQNSPSNAMSNVSHTMTYNNHNHNPGIQQNVSQRMHQSHSHPPLHHNATQYQIAITQYPPPRHPMAAPISHSNSHSHTHTNTQRRAPPPGILTHSHSHHSGQNNQSQPGAEMINNDLHDLALNIKRSPPIQIAPPSNSNPNPPQRSLINNSNHHHSAPGPMNMMNHFLIQSDSEVNLLKLKRHQSYDSYNNQSIPSNRNIINRERASTMGLTNVPEIPSTKRDLLKRDQTVDIDIDALQKQNEKRENNKLLMMDHIQTGLPSHLGVDHLLFHTDSPTLNTNVTNTKLTPVTQQSMDHHHSTGTCIVHEVTPSLLTQELSCLNDAESKHQDQLEIESSTECPTDDGDEIDNDTNKLFMQLKEARYSKKKKKEKIQRLHRKKSRRSSRTSSYRTNSKSRSRSMKTMIIKENDNESAYNHEEEEDELIASHRHHERKDDDDDEYDTDSEEEDETSTEEDTECDDKTDNTRYTIMVTRAPNNEHGIEGIDALDLDESKELSQLTADEHTMDESTEFSFTENTNTMTNTQCVTMQTYDDNMLTGDEDDDSDDNDNIIRRNRNNDGDTDTDSDDEGEHDEQHNMLSVIYDVQKGGGLLLKYI